MLRFVALLVCFVTISSVHAGVIEMDLAAPGDGLLTYDTINKRAWLDLPETGGLELSEVLAQMEPGGRLAGFQFAKLEDVTALAASAGVGWNWTPGPYAEQLIDTLGITVWATGGLLGDTRWSNGLIAKGFVDENPIFDDTNVYIFSNFTPPQPGQINHPFAQTGGGVYSDGPFLWLDGPIFGVGDIGPF